MENLFMYGVSGQDLTECESFLHNLESQANTNYEDSRFIPSPQEILSTQVDPYSGQYDQIFSIGDWERDSQAQPLQQPSPQTVQPSPPQQLQPTPPQQLQPTPPHNPQTTPPQQFQPSPPHQAPSVPQHPLAFPSATSALRSPPVKSESPSDDYGDYQLDAPDISMDSQGVPKRRARKTKTSHNMIEKRYRNNINDKINLLRDAVPGLRDAASTTVVDGIPSIRLNKATVLTKAAEYIEQLKSRNALLQRENTELRAKFTRRYHYPAHAVPVQGPGQVQGQGQHGPYPQPQSHQQQQQQQQSQAPVAQHYISQPPRSSINSNLALGCATAGLVATGSILGSGDNQFRGLSVLPFPQLGWLLAPSNSALKLLFVAASCFIVGTMWVSVLQNWSRKKEHSVDVNSHHHDDRLSARANALHHLGWPQNPGHVFYLFKLFSLFCQSVVALVLGSERLAHLKGLVGFESSPSSGLYSFQLIDTDLASTTKVHWAHRACTFMLAIVHPSANSNMLQAIQVRQLSARLNNMRVLNRISEELWKRCAGPEHLKALAQTPLGDVVSQQYTHITITAQGVKVSDFVALNSADTKIMSTLDLVASLHAYRLQDLTLLGLLQHGSADMSLLNMSSRIAPPRSYAALRVKGLQMLLTKDQQQFQQVLNDIRADVKSEQPVQISFPRLIACAFSRWFADEHPQFAEQVLASQSASLAEICSSTAFVAYYLALKGLHERQLGRSNLVPVTLELRAWFGSDQFKQFGLCSDRRKELVADTLEFARGFAERESDEGLELSDVEIEQF